MGSFHQVSVFSLVSSTGEMLSESYGFDWEFNFFNFVFLVDCVNHILKCEKFFTGFWQEAVLFWIG